MATDASKGWMSVPGIREKADRTLEEQMIGLDLALAEAKGKTVYDLGCAEACIARAFALAGAVDVLGVDVVDTHIEVARKVCADAPQVRLVVADLRKLMALSPVETFDIVLALGIIHKVRQPAVALRYAAKCCKDLLLFRGPGSERLKGWNGMIYPKRGDEACNVPEEMTKQGFVLERQIDGARGEGVHYWRREK